MKKLFISCPIKFRTITNIKATIKKMHQEAEMFFGQKLEIIPINIENIIFENINQEMMCLSNFIQNMSEADFFIGVDWTDICNNYNYQTRLKLHKYFRICDIESQIATQYGIKTLKIKTQDIMPDVVYLPGHILPKFLDNIKN